MNKITVNIFLVFLIIVFLYSAIQCLIPIVYFDLNKDNLNIKLSKKCSEIFEMDFNILVTSYENKNDTEVIINFKNTVEKNSFGEATLSKTIFSRYSLTEVNYTDGKKLTHGFSASKSNFTFFASLITSLVLLLIFIKKRSFIN